MVDSVGMVNAVAGAPAYNGRMLRQLNAVAFAGATAARPLGARSGVRPGTPSTTVTATSTTWTVQPHAGLIDGQAAAEAGPYAFAFDAVATGAVAAASGSIARVDIVYDQIDDPSESDGSSAPAVTRKYLAGTVASTAPALPARSILLAHINVPISGGGSPTVTWKAPYCAAAGGVVDFNTYAELVLWTTADPGQYARVLADGSGYVWRGSIPGWVVSGVGPWTTYTPALGNFSLGTGGQAKTTLEWRYEGDQVHVRGALILGTAGFSIAPSSGAPITISPPVTPQAMSVPAQWLAGRVSLYDSSAGTPALEGVVRFNNSPTSIGILQNSATNIAASVPFVWAAGDVIYVDFTFDPA